MGNNYYTLDESSKKWVEVNKAGNKYIGLKDGKDAELDDPKNAYSSAVLGVGAKIEFDKSPQQQATPSAPAPPSPPQPQPPQQLPPPQIKYSPSQFNFGSAANKKTINDYNSQEDRINKFTANLDASNYPKEEIDKIKNRDLSAIAAAQVWVGTKGDGYIGPETLTKAQNRQRSVAENVPYAAKDIEKVGNLDGLYSAMDMDKTDSTIKPTYRIGIENVEIADVARIQQEINLLIKQDKIKGIEPLVVDGFYGPKTRKGVIKLQEFLASPDGGSRDLGEGKADGKFGIDTYHALGDYLGVKRAEAPPAKSG
mgnify:CR=1 FL=1